MGLGTSAAKFADFFPSLVSRLGHEQGEAGTALCEVTFPRDQVPLYLPPRSLPLCSDLCMMTFDCFASCCCLEALVSGDCRVNEVIHLLDCDTCDLYIFLSIHVFCKF